MFDYIEGEVIAIKSNQISLLTTIKISFEINVLSTKEIILNGTYKIFVQLFKNEEGIYLYGFFNEVDKFLFSELIKINGIGPKTAQNILRKLSSQGLISLIKNRDIEAMQKISSIGTKADRVYYELKNKVTNLECFKTKYHDVFDALLNLGYKADLIFPILESLDDGLSNSEAIKKAIVRLKNE